MGHIPSGETSALSIPAFEEAWREAQEPRDEYDVHTWLYVPSQYGEYRFVLGTRGKNPLFCIGVNPSTASPGDLDPTLKSVERTAKRCGFDSFLMFNLYAQRATDPSSMEKHFNARLHENNIKAFSYLLSQCAEPPVVWAAWGTLIEKRPYLPLCARAFYEAAQPFGARFVSFGARSRAGHPHHPLYLKNDSAPEDFDLISYLDALEGNASTARGSARRGR